MSPLRSGIFNVSPSRDRLARGTKKSGSVVRNIKHYRRFTSSPLLPSSRSFLFCFLFFFFTFLISAIRPWRDAGRNEDN